MRAIVGLALVLSGCAGMHVGEPADPYWESAPGRYDRELAEREAARVAALPYLEMVAPQCDGGSVEPGMHVTHGFRERCGLVTSSFGAPDYQAYAGRFCAGRPAEECQAGYFNMYAARITERYPRADASAVALRCAAQPEECITERQLELQYMDSHNRGVLAERQAQVVADAEQRLASRRATTQAIGSAFQAMGASMQQSFRPAVHCTSRMSVGTVRTDCR